MVILNQNYFSALDIFFFGSYPILVPFGSQMMIRPSSLYSPISIFLILLDSSEIIRAPSSTNTVQASHGYVEKLVVKFFCFFFVHDLLLWKRSDLRQCLIV